MRKLNANQIPVGRLPGTVAAGDDPRFQFREKRIALSTTMNTAIATPPTVSQMVYDVYSESISSVEILINGVAYNDITINSLKKIVFPEGFPTNWTDKDILQVYYGSNRELALSTTMNVAITTPPTVSQEVYDVYVERSWLVEFEINGIQKDDITIGSNKKIVWPSKFPSTGWTANDTFKVYYYTID
jgi:hypothetical protein